MTTLNTLYTNCLSIQYDKTKTGWQKWDDRVRQQINEKMMKVIKMLCCVLFHLSHGKEQNCKTSSCYVLWYCENHKSSEAARVWREKHETCDQQFNCCKSYKHRGRQTPDGAKLGPQRGYQQTIIPVLRWPVPGETRG